MAAGTTMRRFEIALSDSDRGVYESLELRAAQHPSETDRYLVARVIARCLEHAEGVEFTRGLSEADEPALWQRDLRGDLQAWIEVGAPSPERLHRALKTGARVVVYGWQRVADHAKQIAAFGVHRQDELALHALDPAFLDRLASKLDRTNRWELSISGGTIYASVGGEVVEGVVERIAVG